MESAPPKHIVYEYATDNSKMLQDIAKWCNKRSEEGWEFVSMISEDERIICLFRRPKQ